MPPLLHNSHPDAALFLCSRACPLLEAVQTAGLARLSPAGVSPAEDALTKQRDAQSAEFIIDVRYWLSLHPDSPCRVCLSPT